MDKSIELIETDRHELHTDPTVTLRTVNQLHSSMWTSDHTQQAWNDQTPHYQKTI